LGDIGNSVGPEKAPLEGVAGKTHLFAKLHSARTREVIHSRHASILRTRTIALIGLVNWLIL
jgi:hypothetical protein